MILPNNCYPWNLNLFFYTNEESLFCTLNIEQGEIFNRQECYLDIISFAVARKVYTSSLYLSIHLKNY